MYVSLVQTKTSKWIWCWLFPGRCKPWCSACVAWIETNASHGESSVYIVQTGRQHKGGENGWHKLHFIGFIMFQWSCPHPLARYPRLAQTPYKEIGSEWDLRIRVLSYQTTSGVPATFIPSEGGNPETPCPMVLSLYKVYTILTTPIKPSISLQPQPLRYYSVNLDRLLHQLIWWSFDDWTRTVCYVTLPTGLYPNILTKVVYPNMLSINTLPCSSKYNLANHVAKFLDIVSLAKFPVYYSR